MPIFGKKLHAIILTKKDNIDTYKKNYYLNVKNMANFQKGEQKKFILDQSVAAVGPQGLKYRKD